MKRNSCFVSWLIMLGEERHIKTLGMPRPNARARGRVRRAAGSAEMTAGDGEMIDLEIGEVRRWTTV